MIIFQLCETPASEYKGEKAVQDLIAGLTVGLTVIPQGLAYAILAGLPTQYGLYSSFMGVFIYRIRLSNLLQMI